MSEYIGSAQPVGSQLIAQAPGVNVSSATVRSEMVALEHEGFLVQPHTSAGRIPTDKGYRFFVDHLAEPGLLGPGPAPQGAPVLRPGARRDGGDARADLGTAVGADLLRRRGGRPVARDVHRPVGPAGGPGPARGPCWWSSCRTARWRSGRSSWTRTSARTTWPRHGPAAGGGPGAGRSTRWRPFAPDSDPAVERVIGAAAAALGDLVHDEERDQVFVGGPSQLAAAFDAVETVRSGARHPRAAAGRGDPAPRRARDGGCRWPSAPSTATSPSPRAPWWSRRSSVDGRDAGAVGLLGPTRMDYPRALAAAHVVGERLGEALGFADGGTTRRAVARAARPDGPSRRWTPCRFLMACTTSTGCSGCRPTPPTRRSSGPTASGPASCIPTPTRAIPRPRRGSRRCRWPTRCSGTPSGGPATTVRCRGGLRPGRRRSGRRVRLRRRAGRPLRGVLRLDGRHRRARRAAVGRQQGADAEVSLRLDFAEAAFGARKDLSVRLPVTCDELRGHRGPAGDRGRRRARIARGRVRSGASASRCWARW